MIEGPLMVGMNVVGDYVALAAAAAAALGTVDVKVLSCLKVSCLVFTS